MTNREIAKAIDELYPNVEIKDLAPWIMETYNNNASIIRQLYSLRERNKLKGIKKLIFNN